MAKTVEEMIAVMQGYKDGKKIEVSKVNRNDWVNDREPLWDWINFNYRIAEEPKYRPYNDTEEMIADYCKRFEANYHTYELPLIWVKIKVDGLKRIITDYDKGNVFFSFSAGGVNMTTLFNNYTFLDNSPIGVKE